MAEDHNQLHRSSESVARTGQTRASAGSDPLAELARLIGQSDPFGDVVNGSARLAESAGTPPHDDWTAASTQPHQERSFAPSHYSYGPAEGHHAPAQNYAQPAQAYAQESHPGETYAQPQDADFYQPAESEFGKHEFYEDAPPSRRRIGVLAVAAIFGLAVIGSAGAFGYRSLFGGGAGSRVTPIIAADKSPLKVVPNNAGGEGKKAIADRVTNDPMEKVLPREEKPIDIAQKIAETTPATQQSPMPPTGNGVIAGEPKKVHTIVVRPDGTEAPQVAMASPMPPMSNAPATPQAQAQQAPATTSAPSPRQATATTSAPPPKPAAEVRAQAAANSPLSLNPNAAEPASRPVRTANAAPTSVPPAAAAPTGHTVAYAVQVSSQKSEAEAKAAYRGLENKYASQLSGKQMFVYKVDLGAKGIYYRTMVGPYANASEATELCSNLKAAGATCIVQRN